MTNIEKQNYGFKITFAGLINQNEMSQWVESSRNSLLSQGPDFGVMVDMRELSPLSEEAKALLQEGQVLYKEKGMTRSVVVVNQGFIATQFKMMAQDSGIYEWERYIDASSKPNWEKIGIDWIVNNIDPDQN